MRPKSPEPVPRLAFSCSCDDITAITREREEGRLAEGPISRPQDEIDNVRTMFHQIDEGSCPIILLQLWSMQAAVRGSYRETPGKSAEHLDVMTRTNSCVLPADLT